MKRKQIIESVSFEELSKLIITAIRDENFFDKEVLIPKVRAIIRSFHPTLSSYNYNKIEKPTETAKRLREIQKLELEKTFWQRKCKELSVDQDQNYKELDALYEKVGFRNYTPVRKESDVQVSDTTILKEEQKAD